MFTCPNCSTETPKLIGSVELKKVVCPACYKEKGRIGYNYRLHEVVANENGYRVTRGKAFEIDNRVISKDDNMTVINKVTGAEAQY